MGPCCWKVGQTAVAQARPALDSENLGSWAALSSVSMAIAVPSMPTVPVWGWPSRGWLRSEGCLSLCCCYSIANSCLTPCNPMDCSSQASLSFIISRSLLKLMSIESMMPFNHLHPLSAPCPSALNLSQHQGLPLSWLFASCGQSIRVSASALVL